MTAAAPGPEWFARRFGVHSDDPAVVRTAVERIASPSFERWEQQVTGCGYCARPVRLTGTVTRHDRATGARVGVGYSTSGEPDGTLLVRCGNRRATVCPSCSREYAGDMWHLLHAGIAGGSKGVPAAVATRPLVFATLTAPSFGLVHTTRQDDRSGRTARCRPRRDGSRLLCPHGRATWCMAIHTPDDERLGAPLCEDCHDAEALVWFNFYASAELWRRFTTALPRALAARLGMSERRLRQLLRVQYAKVAEFQRRGVVHFHAVLRLDGPATPGDPYPAPLLEVPIDVFTDAVRDAAGRVTYRVPQWREDRPGVVLRFGRQVDVTPIRGNDLQDGAVTPSKVAGYIAKYATKGCDDFGLEGRLSGPGDLDLRPVPVPAHVRRLVETVHQLASVEPRLSRWLHMLGFPGHFATKSRCFSTTMGALRRQRRHHRLSRTAGPVDEMPDDDLDDDETTLVVGTWRFAGLGYRTSGDVELAAAAAARARERRDLARAAHPRPARSVHTSGSFP